MWNVSMMRHLKNGNVLSVDRLTVEGYDAPTQSEIEGWEKEYSAKLGPDHSVEATIVGVFWLEDD